MSNTDELRAVAQQALVALVHHTEQTRPIQRTADAIAALRAALAQHSAPSAEPATDLREKLIDAIADGLGSALHCNRVWSAWNVGTMSKSDFSSVAESDTPAELADVVLAIIGAAPQAAPVVAGERPTRDDFVRVARCFALGYGLHEDAPSYLPRTEDERDAFEPHAWVILLAMQAYRDGRADGLATTPPAEPAAPLLANGMTEAETRETASVAGLVLRITTAYEQGFGHAWRLELSNPYKASTPEHEAWDMGREVGQRKTAAAQPPSAPLPAPLSQAQITAAAKALADAMDYPWGPMPAAARENMRQNVLRVLAAAGITATTAQPKG